MSNNKKIYFASDAHFGLSGPDESLPREKLFARWLETVRKDAAEIYLLGDIFDFWFEYRRVVPRGFTRILGKIAEITDSGIPVHFFTGNHDIWVFDYLPAETGMIIHKGPYITSLYGKKFYMAHGDGLDERDSGFKVLKKIFTNPVLQWLFARLHPNFALWFGHKWSHKSRYSKELITPFKGEEEEEHMVFANRILENEHFDYFVFGHRHIPLDLPLKNNSSRYINLGDWLWHFTYAVFDGNTLEIKKYSP
ncbi:MAG: UDP-2,3-diacylglucosamine diphosphatase [bacterium]